MTTTMEPITHSEIMTTFAEILDDYGRDWVDPQAREGEPCLYIYDGKPTEGVSRDVLPFHQAPHGGPARCLIGELIWRLRNVQIRHRAGVWALIETHHQIVTDNQKTTDLLMNMQGQQDNGATWGEIYDRTLAAA